MENFNSRPSARGDRGQTSQRHMEGISIHAPPRGATGGAGTLLLLFGLFQFTPLREGRRTTRTSTLWRKPFQFTPLREGRPLGEKKYSVDFVFQFTPLREGRPSSKTPRSPFTFQFTPLREGRRILAGSRQRSGHFNSRPSARGDSGAKSSSTRRIYFNSRPSARGDISAGSPASDPSISIHAPPRGATFVGRQGFER